MSAEKQLREAVYDLTWGMVSWMGRQSEVDALDFMEFMGGSREIFEWVDGEAQAFEANFAARCSPYATEECTLEYMEEIEIWFDARMAQLLLERTT